MIKFWEKLSLVGINNSNEIHDKKSIVIINRIAAIIWFLCFLSLWINVLLQSYMFIPILLFALALLPLSYFLNYHKIYTLSKINTLSIVIIVLLYMSFNGGYGSGLEYYFLSFIPVLIFIFPERKYVYLFLVICLGSLAAIKFYAAAIDTNTLPHKVFYVFNTVGSSLIIFLVLLFYKNLSRINEKLLKEKSIQIEEKNSQLESINKQLDTFSYSVSHDLKSPLRAIDGYAALLERKYAEKLFYDDKDLLFSIRDNISQMRNLIENLLLFSRSSKKELEVKEINMVEVTNRALKPYISSIEKTKITLTIDYLPNALADEALIAIVFDNLISNAIKYTKGTINPNIHIGAYSEDDKNIYFIKDNGVGFDMKYANKLFTPFQRLHDKAEYEGSGVGLSIVKSIIQRLKGNVWAESQKGQGSTFYLSLPKPTKLSAEKNK